VTGTSFNGTPGCEEGNLDEILSYAGPVKWVDATQLGRPSEGGLGVETGRGGRSSKAPGGNGEKNQVVGRRGQQNQGDPGVARVVNQGG